MISTLTYTKRIWHLLPLGVYSYRHQQPHVLTEEMREEKEGMRKEPYPTLKCHRIHSFSLFFSHKIVTTGPLKNRKCTRKRLATGWKRSTDPLAAIWGLLLREGRKGKGRGDEEGKGKGRKKERGKGEPSHF